MFIQDTWGKCVNCQTYKWYIFYYIIARKNSSAEIPLILRFYAVVGLVCGIFLISIFNMSYFKNSLQKFRLVNGSLTIIMGCIVLYFIINLYGIFKKQN